MANIGRMIFLQNNKEFFVSSIPVLQLKPGLTCDTNYPMAKTAMLTRFAAFTSKQHSQLLRVRYNPLLFLQQW